MALTRNLSFLESLFVPIREAKQKFQQFVESPTTSSLAQFVGGRQSDIRQQTAQLGQREITQLPETSPFRYLPGKLAEQTVGATIPQTLTEAGIMAIPFGTLAKPLAKTPIGRLATKEIFKIGEKVGIKELPGKVLKVIKDTGEAMVKGRNPETGGISQIGRKALNKIESEIPKELEPLAQEAKKYKSAEEFVKAQFSKKPEYGMSHRPSYEGMPPSYNLLEGEVLPSLQRLKSVRDNETAKNSDVIVASNSLLDRFLGKPVQPISEDAKAPSEMSDEEIRKQIERELTSTQPN